MSPRPDLSALPGSQHGASAANKRLLADAVELDDWLDAFKGSGAALAHDARFMVTPAARAVLEDAAAKLISVEANLESALKILRYRMKDIRFEGGRRQAGIGTGDSGLGENR